MSLAAMLWVMEHSEARLPERWVLLLIANDADDLGFDAHPSQRRLSFMSRAGQSTVRRMIDRLEGAGELLVRRPDKPAPGKFSRYVVVMGRDPLVLAEQLGWPGPKLDPVIRREWEQLALETEHLREQHAASGYTLEPRSVPVAPYPVDNPGDDVVDDPISTGKPRQSTTKPRQSTGVTAPPMSGADPSLTPSDPRRFSVESTREMLEAERERSRIDAMVGDPTKVHELIDQARGKLPREPDPDEGDRWEERRDLA